MNSYEEKQQRRRERYEQRAEKARAESKSRANSQNVQTLAGMMGEPVKIGHHSEQRHRKLIERADNDMRRAVEAEDRAEHYAEKANAVGCGGVSSDDPDALAKLRAELAERESWQETMKNANRIIRGKSREADKLAKLEALGYTPEEARKVIHPENSWQTVGYPSYKLTNNNASIRRIRGRISAMEASRAQDDVTKQFGEIEYREEGNRVKFIFPGKPDGETRKVLKSHGFRWAPSAGAWQRFLNNSGRQAASRVAEALGILQ